MYKVRLYDAFPKLSAKYPNVNIRDFKKVPNIGVELWQEITPRTVIAALKIPLNYLC
jgi:hypothetical protein